MSRFLTPAMQQLCTELPELFKPDNCIGCLKDFELDSRVNHPARPIFCKSFTVPFAMLEDHSHTYDAGRRGFGH